MTRRRRFKVVEGDKLRDRIGRGDSGFASLVVMSDDESTETRIRLDADELPHSPCGWSLCAATVFVEPMAERLQLGQTSGPDTLFVEFLADRPTRTDSSRRRYRDGEGEHVADIEPLRGHVACVETEGSADIELAHLSEVEAIGCSFVWAEPSSEDRAKHPRMPDGRRIAAVRFDGLAPSLLRFLASRSRLPDSLTDRGGDGIIRLPTPSGGLLPGTPSRGRKRPLTKDGRGFDRVMAEQNAQRVPVAVVVQLDEVSAQLAAKTRTKHRKSGIQLRIPYPANATTVDELAAAVSEQLEHFDTDYLLSFDAIVSLLNQSPDGVALDAALERKVVDMRFGDTATANNAQRRRVAAHLQTLREVRVEVRPKDGTKTFRGPILLKAGEVFDESGAFEPLKEGDAIVLNPILFRDIARGKGIYLSAKYLRLDPYRNDFHLRLYRYLAHRWSCSSTRLAESGWELRIALQTALDMSGTDLRPMVERRGQPEARRRVEQTMGELQADGMLDSWSIQDDGRTLVVEVPRDIRRELERQRPGLHADAASGALRLRKQARKRSRKAESKRP
jgi:hypothetical protein